MRKSALWFTCSTVLVTFTLVAVSIHGEARSAPDVHGLGFGKRIAGTYFLSFPLKGLLTVSADGTVAGETEESFGFFQGEVPDRFASSYRGTWRRTGQSEIEMRLTRMNFQEDGTPLVFVDIRAHFTFTDRELARGSGELEFQACDFDTWSPYDCSVLNAAVIPFELSRFSLGK